MPLHLHPAPADAPSVRHASRAYDARVRPYEDGYRVMRGYEAAPRAADRAPEPAAWFGGRARDGR